MVIVVSLPGILQENPLFKNPSYVIPLQIFYYSKWIFWHKIDMKDFLRVEVSQIEGKIV